MNPELEVTTARAQEYEPGVAARALSGAEYRALCEQSPVMIWRSGLDARCDYFNETWLSFTGRTMEEEIGEGWLANVHPEDEERCIELYLDRFRRRESFEMEYRLRRHDGVYRWIFDRGLPLFGPDGGFKGFVGSCVDIDDRRRAQSEREQHHQETLALYHELREREAKIRRLIDSNIVGIVFADRESRVTEANDAYLELLGYTREDVQLGKLRWRNLTPPEWSAVSERAAVQMREKGACDVFEKEYFRKDGSRVPVLLGVASYGAFPNETVAFVLDLSDRKRAEQERERLRTELAYMSRILTMGELAGSIAHDIKQPITAAQVSADTCVRWLSRPVPDIDEVRAAAARMSIEVRRASHIIDRVRSLYTRSAPRRDSVDLNELAREMAALLEHEATEHDVSIKTDLDATLPEVRGDRVQLQQVLLNLMLNAIEAMKGASGELRIASRSNENGAVHMAVIDSGIGLPTENVERIFDAFFTTKPNGTGMGLSISRAIIESHGGRLWASANPADGATFQFTLPNEQD